MGIEGQLGSTHSRNFVQRSERNTCLEVLIYLHSINSLRTLYLMMTDLQVVTSVSGWSFPLNVLSCMWQTIRFPYPPSQPRRCSVSQGTRDQLSSD